MSPPVAFYCVCDARYFLGAVAMINSLRLQGHDEPVHVLDVGLEPRQRELLAEEALVVGASPTLPAQLLKTVAPLRHPAEVRVLIDADMIVTRPLVEPIEQARAGGVVAFCDRQADRHFAEWGELLGLGPARRGPYLSSGLVFLGSPTAETVLGLLEQTREAVDYGRTFWGANERDYPFLYADQDLFNAILATRVSAERVGALPARLAATPPYRQLRLRDLANLRCAYDDGIEPFVLHQFVRKPWLEPVYHGIYSRLFVRLLLGEDVALRVSPAELPLRMRRGLVARANRMLVDGGDLGRYYLGDLLPQRIGTRVEAWRRARSAR